MNKKSLDDVLNNFKPAVRDSIESRKPITLWIPEDYKYKFDNLQKKTACKFGKLLQELVRITIDKTEENV